MPIIVSGSGDYTPAPAGMHSAVCADVVDHGMVEGTYGVKHKVSLVFLIDETMEDGKPFSVHRRYTASLNEKATLYRDLVSWRGKAFTAAELAAFDLENLICVPCMVNVVQEERDGKTYANVASISPLPKGMQPMKVPGDYVRKKDRPDDGAPQNGSGRVHDDDKQPPPLNAEEQASLEANEPPF